jgi:hypothetical protein
MRPAFCVSYGSIFTSEVVLRMNSLVAPGLDTLRQWLDELGISFFECDTCQALHLPHMQNFDGVFDAKIDLINDVSCLRRWRK